MVERFSINPGLTSASPHSVSSHGP